MKNNINAIIIIMSAIIVITSLPAENHTKR